MKPKKKSVFLILTAILAVGALTACAPAAQTVSPAAANPTEAAATETAAAPTAVVTEVPTAAATQTAALTEEATSVISSVTWNNGVSQLFTGTCGSCHSGGRMNLTTYSSVVQNSSQILAVQQRRHKANFSSTDLNTIIDWINAGAPEN